MSVPNLAGEGPISGDESFYIPYDEASHTIQPLAEAEEATPSALKDTEKLEVAVPPLDGAFEIAVDQNSVQPPYIGDDARLALLRDILVLFKKLARESSGSGARISEETLLFLPGILRTVIQFSQERQRQNELLQGAQETLRAETRQMKDEIDVLKRDNVKVKELYASTKAQKDSLEEQLNENKPRTTPGCGTEGSSKKRRRDE